MALYHRVRLGSEAARYISASLAEGRTLSKRLRSSLDLSKGEAVVFIPDGTTSAGLLKFEEAILPEPHESSHVILEAQGRMPSRLVPIPNLDEALLAVVIRFLARGLTTAAVFENSMAKPTDPWLRKAKILSVNYNDDVLHVVLPGDPREEVEQTIKQATYVYPPLIGVLTWTGDTKLARDRMTSLSDPDLERIVQGTELLVVGAYHAEGHLIWSRQGAESLPDPLIIA